MYEHGGGLDAPLGVVRMEYSDELHDAQVIAPHATWRGTYDRGTPITGQCLVFSSNGKQLAPPPDSTPTSGDQYGGVVGGGTYDGTREHCIDVDWPSAYTWSARQYRRGYAGPDSWMGSLIFESRDASGLYYRRNRYYDAENGRFTQEDPIGLAGGTNVYGFANGDALGYSDPYGLAVDTVKFSGDDNGEIARAEWNQLRADAHTAIESRNASRGFAGFVVLSILDDAEVSSTVFEINIGRQLDGWRALYTGGGAEGGTKEANGTDCPSIHCVIRLDPEINSDIPLGIKLGHEVTGALLHLYGISHLSDLGAVSGENAVRLMYGCSPRLHHDSKVAGCVRP
jgi:RHS repeat-associated protein